MKKEWKRRATQVGLFSLLAAVAVGGTGASAADSGADEAGQTTAPATLTVSSVSALPGTFAMTAPMLSVQAGSIGGGLLMTPAHERNYLRLLAESYTPDDAAKWREALAERKQAEADMADAMAKLAPKPVKLEASSEGVRLEASPVLPPLPEVKEGKLSASGPFGTLPTLTLQAKPLPAGETATAASNLFFSYDVKGTDAIKWEEAELPASIKLQNELTAAVEADDAAKIRELLPQLLDQYREDTKNLQESVKNLPAPAPADEPSEEPQPDSAE
ncbi:MAG: hypothetical protein J7639_34080 [Paenibacillaceae bacterium]|nr:hypothetical protein [Paenibacillaceae bacterium]